MKCWELGRCAVNDDFTRALEDHHWADIIVWATPVYIDDMIGILKLFTNRMFILEATCEEERILSNG